MRALRERWDWLRDLLARGRAQLSLPATTRTRLDALRDALGQLGLDDRTLLEGIGAVLRLPVATLRAPTPAALEGVMTDDLAVVLPLLVEHRSPTIAAVGRAWLAMPETLYAVAMDQTERWLVGSSTVADLLAPRIDREGLAWLGPDALRRLASDAASPRARRAAAAWCERVGQVEA